MSARHHPLSRPVILSEKERKGDRVRRMPRQSSAWSSKLRSGGVVSVVWVQLFADFSAVQLTSWTVLLPWGQDSLSLPPLHCCLLLSSSPPHLSFSLHLFISVSIYINYASHFQNFSLSPQQIRTYAAMMSEMNVQEKQNKTTTKQQQISQ